MKNLLQFNSTTVTRQRGVANRQSAVANVVNEPPTPQPNEVDAIITNVVKSKKPAKVNGKQLGAVTERAIALGMSGGATSVHPDLIEEAKENGGELSFQIEAVDEFFTLRPTKDGNKVYQTLEFSVEGLPNQHALLPRGLQAVEKGQVFNCLISSQDGKGILWNYTLSVA